MILYNSPNPAPNPRRVRIFAAEKGIALPMRDLSIPAREHKADAYLAINPRGQVPALVLDDGTVITESVAICRYLEGLHPQPPLFGTSPLEQANIEMWSRRVEMILMQAVGVVWVHTHRFTAVLPGRNAEWGEANRPRALEALRYFDTALNGREFIAGEGFSMADILMLTTFDFAKFIGLEIPTECNNLLEWHARISVRPSAAA